MYRAPEPVQFSRNHRRGAEVSQPRLEERCRCGIKQEPRPADPRSHFPEQLQPFPYDLELDEREACNVATGTGEACQAIYRASCLRFLDLRQKSSPACCPPRPSRSGVGSPSAS